MVFEIEQGVVMTDCFQQTIKIEVSSASLNVAPFLFFADDVGLLCCASLVSMEITKQVQLRVKHLVICYRHFRLLSGINQSCFDSSYSQNVFFYHVNLTVGNETCF